MRSRPLFISIVTLCLVSAVHADYRDSFRRGIQAARRSRWAEVVTAMREARAEEPRDTGERINISGMDFVPYVPSFHLGLALYNLQDCVGALQAWQTLEAQGGIQRVTGGQRGVVAKNRKDCESRAASSRSVAPTEKPVPAGPDPVVVERTVQAVNTALARAQDAERFVAEIAGDDLLERVWRSDGALGPSEQRAKETLARARTELEAGRRDSNVQRLQEAATLAGTAAKEFIAIRQTAESRRTQLANEAAAAAAAKPAEPRPSATAPVTAPVNPTPVNPPPVSATTTGATPAAAPTPNTPQPFTPPPALAAAARLFFTAQYAEAASSLSKQRYSETRAAGHAALLRAASQYAMYLIGGEKDAQLIDSARRDVREARRVAPALQPDPRAFSPRFIEFYRSTR